MLFDYCAEVIDNRDCGRGLKLLRLMPDKPFDCAPGQFVMIDLMRPDFFFRRPFSVMSVQPGGGFDIFYKIVGKGTAIMAEWTAGQSVLSLGPLGKSFRMPEEPETALFIGGGIGIAPMFLFGEKLLQAGTLAGHCIYGARTHAELGLAAELDALFGGDRMHYATDDGSFGFHGNVCDMLASQPERVMAAKEAYVCGPTPMMAAVYRHLAEVNPALRVQVSLEEHMPCGTGACTGCAVFRTDQALPAKVCVEGPVFEAASIRWDRESCSVMSLDDACGGEAAVCPG